MNNMREIKIIGTYSYNDKGTQIISWEVDGEKTGSLPEELVKWIVRGYLNELLK